MTRPRFWLVLTAVVAGLLPDIACAGNLPHPDDFAYGRTLALPAGSAIGECELPLAVYAKVVSAELGDLAVFNAAGELVPFQLSPPLLPPPVAAAVVAIPFYPLPGSDQSVGEGALEVTIGSRREGTNVQVRSTSAPPAAQRVYLLDLRALAQPIERFELVWSGASDALLRVTIGAGDDPAGPMTPVADATLYRLQYDGSRLVQEGIELVSPQRGLLRIAVSGAPADFRLDAVRGTAASAAPAPRSSQLQLTATPVGDGNYLFTLSGALPLARLRIHPPQPNTLARVSLSSRAANDAPWIRRGGGLLYALRVSGADLVSSPFAVVGHDRFWRLTVEGSGGGFGGGAPRIEVDWQPQRLRFIARGDGPFLLAYGSGRPDRQGLLGGEGLALTDSDGRPLLAADASLGPEETLAGDAALRRRLTPQRWKQIVLWSALVGSVLLLAAMAFRLQRRLGAASDKEGQR